MLIPDDKKAEILQKSDVFDVLSDFLDLKKSGSAYVCECPMCHASGKGKGLQVTKAKGIYKCFGCGFGGNTAVSYLLEVEKKSYPDALKWLADKYNIVIEDGHPKGPQRKLNKKPETFRDKQLKLSGIPDAQQKATVWDGDKQIIVDTYVAGTRNEYYQLDFSKETDMIIWYYNLEGRPVMYQKPKSTKTEHLYRVRWQNPSLHCDKSGRPMKYSSPYGSGSHLYIPEMIRQMYRDKRVIKRLYVQEGEKKTDKSCMHGLPSVGIMGIHNIASEGKLPYEFQQIIKDCHVQEVMLLLDADCYDLGQNLLPGERVDKRPYSFFYAVRNFREYFKAFENEGIYLEIYFGHVKPNEKHDKGIDDLLTNTLTGREIALMDDVNRSVLMKDGSGEFVQVHKISTMADLKLLELWNLHNTESFARRYKTELSVLPEFLIGKHKWRFDENGKLEPAQPLQEDEIYFEKITRRTRGGDDYDTFKFKYRKCYKFLSRRGFGRYEYGGQDKYTWVHIENRIVKEIVPHKVRDYVLEFTEAIAEQADIDEVMDMFFRGSKMYLGPDSLSHLSYVYPHFETSEKDSQIMFFRDKYWMITAEGIEEHPMGDLKHMVWKDKVREFDARLVAKEFNVVTRIDDDFLKANPAKAAMLEDYKGQFDIIASKEARECHFQQFLINTGEFFWDKFIDNKEGWKPKLENGKPVDTRSLAEKFETNLHFLSKTTAFGFLLHHYRDKSCEKAVIGMDGKIGVVGDSNGRSGKSIFGFGLAEVVPQHVIPGKAKDLMEDKFLLEGVTEKTENIFINDVRANFDFEFLFPLIEDKLVINAKGSQKYTLPKSSIQKFYIATNHAINGDTGSYRDRQHLIAFSDYYNENHKPVDDFGVTFFDAWDDIQRNLFYNYAAYALHLYFKAARMGWGVNGSGLIQCPVQRLERRKLRQFIGETFLTWADEYYGAGDDIREADIGQDPGTGLPITNSHINTRIFRKELWDDFIENNKQESKYMNAHKFKKKLIAWCKFRGLAFNPQKQEFDGMISDDKSGGKEFFTVANSRYAL